MHRHRRSCGNDSFGDRRGGCHLGDDHGSGLDNWRGHFGLGRVGYIACRGNAEADRRNRLLTIHIGCRRFNHLARFTVATVTVAATATTAATRFFAFTVNVEFFAVRADARLRFQQAHFRRPGLDDWRCRCDDRCNDGLRQFLKLDFGDRRAIRARFAWRTWRTLGAFAWRGGLARRGLTWRGLAW
ncbi:MAG TPA: hypothetical protein DCW29_25315, partial [Janthinobacterium sp.]|nr:hypothetical protein [Janthinobacterium sp.]